jgi:hypothetical protein
MPANEIPLLRELDLSGIGAQFDDTSITGYDYTLSIPNEPSYASLLPDGESTSGSVALDAYMASGSEPWTSLAISENSTP